MNVFFLSIVFNIIAVGAWFYNVMNTGHWFFDGLTIEGILFLVFGTSSFYLLMVTIRETKKEEIKP